MAVHATAVTHQQLMRRVTPRTPSLTHSRITPVADRRARLVAVATRCTDTGPAAVRMYAGCRDGRHCGGRYCGSSRRTVGRSTGKAARRRKEVSGGAAGDLAGPQAFARRNPRSEDVWKTPRPIWRRYQPAECFSLHRLATFVRTRPFDAEVIAPCRDVWYARTEQAAWQL